jgi:hypothetical protein
MAKRQSHTSFLQTSVAGNIELGNIGNTVPTQAYQSGAQSGMSILNLKEVQITTKNFSGELKTNELNVTEDVVTDIPKLAYRLSNDACIFNSGFSGKIGSDCFIYSPWDAREDEGRDYILCANTGNFHDSGVRYIFMPDCPDEIYTSDISSGDTSFDFFSAPQTREAYSKYATTGELGNSGTKFEVRFGYHPNAEKIFITGVSGASTALISGESSGCFTGTYGKGTKICATDAIHSSPSGETGYAREFQVRIDAGQHSQDRFFISKSGITGGCHLGGTFTGSGYDFEETPVIDVYKGFTYYFNQHHDSNANQKIMFSYTSGGHHEGADNISGAYQLNDSPYCYRNYCTHDCPRESTLMIPFETGLGDKIYYYASGTAGVGGTGYLNVLTSGDGGN